MAFQILFQSFADPGCEFNTLTSIFREGLVEYMFVIDGGLKPVQLWDTTPGSTIRRRFGEV